MSSAMARPSCCLLVPLYRPSLSRAEALSLVISHARGGLAADLHVLHPPDLGPFVADVRAWFAQMAPQAPGFRSLVRPASDFSSLEAYSALMLTPELYAQLEAYTWMLMVQPDALLLSDRWSDWLASPWCYVGAPFFEGLERPSHPLRLLGGGNGGVSLRRIQACLAVLRRRGWLYPALRRKERICLPRERLRAELRALRSWGLRSGRPAAIPIYEDLFWSFVAPALDRSFKLPSASESARFAFEAEPRHLLQLTGELPAACHAHERYDPSFWRATFEANPGLIAPYATRAEGLYRASATFASAAVVPRP